ncbi:hypothetical protein BSKO_12659 [Bryopsis sp. KO-2023]|nr:hypothetical protein BSKO_12659 [Bryopsis sp. KO-2023]
MKSVCFVLFALVAISSAQAGRAVEEEQALEHSGRELSRFFGLLSCHNLLNSDCPSGFTCAEEHCEDVCSDKKVKVVCPPPKRAFATSKIDDTLCISQVAASILRKCAPQSAKPIFASNPAVVVVVKLGMCAAAYFP